MQLEETPLIALEPHGNLLQSPLWALSKRALGHGIRSFRYEVEGRRGTLLSVISELGSGRRAAYCPWAPDDPVPEAEQGHYLELLGTLLGEELDPNTLFIRFDLPWHSPYAEEGEEVPDTRLREMRMNFATEQWALRKAPSDVQPPHTLVVDLRAPEDRILARMHPKTRYNIRLARRRGVTVREGSPEELGHWYALYTETMRRNHTRVHREEFFDSLIEAGEHQEKVPRRAQTMLKLFLAEVDGELRSGMILALQGAYALYLYGASGSRGRESMSTYALQWHAIRYAKAAGCGEYDLSGIPDDDHPGHPMHGLLRFKLGFGGEHVVRRGCWDYPLLKDEYPRYAGFELTDAGYHAPS
jgi:lipid II:glycine glycyltransferase (peptidoglycan interpeptide bridge formation enzyme)